MARAALAALGPMSRGERIMSVVSACMLVAWIFGSRFGVDATSAALIAFAVLLLTGVLDWEDVLREREAWNTFVWFAVLVMMAGFLGQLGVITAFSAQVTSALGNSTNWIPGFLGLSLAYFYAHYFFASNTAHVGAMFAPFLVVALALGTPPMLATLVLAFFSNLFACLTHYGTAPGPVLFSSGHVPITTWWKAGAILSVVHIAIWLVVGGWWWKVLGHW